MSALPKPSPEPTKAQMLAAMLSGPTETASMQMTRQFLFRLPEHVAAQVEAMAELSKKSRNLIGNELIETALDIVRAELPKEVLDNLDQLTILKMSDMQADTSGRELTKE